MAKQNVKTKTSGAGAWFKERIRKILVFLKRNPQGIPLLALTVSFVILSFNLTDISDTTARVQENRMGFWMFVSMLLSILSYVCMFSAFPKRQKPNLPMVLLMLAMYAIIIVADINYLGGINLALQKGTLYITVAEQYILNAYYYVEIHIVTTIITMVCVVLEPVFAKLLKKINTSIEVEGNGELAAIDISDED